MPTTSSAFGVFLRTSSSTKSTTLTAKNTLKMMTPQAMTEFRLETSRKKRSGLANPAFASTTSTSVPTATATGAMTNAILFMRGAGVLAQFVSAPRTNAPAPRPARNR